MTRISKILLILPLNNLKITNYSSCFTTGSFDYTDETDETATDGLKPTTDRASTYTLVDIVKNLHENEPFNYFLISSAEDPIATLASMSDEATSDIIFDKLLALLEGADISYLCWTMGFVMENLHRKHVQN